MKKSIFTFLIALSLAMPTFAQFYPDGRPIPPRHRTGYNQYSPVIRSAYQSTYYGFRAGLNMATVNSDSPFLDANKAKGGLNAGVVVGTRLAQMTPLYFETGLYYTEKGGKSTYSGNKFTYGLSYLEVPLVLKYRYYAGRELTIEPFVGGYLAGGIGGKIKDFGSREAYSSFSDDTPYRFKRFDGGLRVGCGIGIQALYLEAGYDFGLANVGQDDFDDTHTGNLNLKVGVNF